jgi:type I restriction enzyme S subunit
MESDCHGWRECTVGELASTKRNAIVGGPFGSNLVSRDYTPDGVPVIRGKNLSWGGRNVGGEFVYVSEDKADSLSANLAHPGDLVFTQRGNAVLHGGQVALVPEGPYERYVVSQSQMKMSPDPAVTDTTFLYYIFTSRDHELYLRNNSIATGVPHTNLGILREYLFLLPPLPEQREIAHILRALDDRIELNRRMNATLEGMAQALFKSWFVDFDPVIDNALVAGNPIPEELTARAELRRTALDNGTANRKTAKPFPDAFVETEELGWIPDGWEATTFGEHVSFQTGPAFKSKEFAESGTRLARGDNVKEGQFHWGDKTRYWADMDESLEKYLLKNGDVLLGMDGSKVGKNRVRVRATDLPCLLVQRVARLWKKETICNGFIFLVVNSQRFRDYVDVIKTGSAIPHISGGQIKELPLSLPIAHDSPIFREFERLTDSLFERTDTIVAHSISLTTLRDTLLPKLISGELRIPDAEKLAEAALA